jgi:single-stranded-DNA-specific exonuclease
MAFRQADTALGQALLGAGSTRRLWLAGRAKVAQQRLAQGRVGLAEGHSLQAAPVRARDDRADMMGGRDVAELHVEDAAWAD